MRKFLWIVLVFVCVVGAAQALHADDENAPAPAESPRSLTFPAEGIIERADGTIVFFYRTNFVTPAELRSSLTKLLAVPDVTFKEFPQQNVLLMEGEPDAVEVALEAAGYFDVSRPQVFVQMKIIRVTNASAAGTVLRAAEAEDAEPVVRYDVLGSTAQGLTVSEGTLEALRAEGKAELVSRPSVLAMQDMSAEVTFTEERHATRLMRADRNNETHQSVVLTTRVRLLVMATHIGESFVTLKVSPEVQDLEQASPVASGSLEPALVGQSLTTTVTVGDGESVVLAGVYRKGSTEQDAAPPVALAPLVASDLPRATQAEQKSEVFVVLTPTIVRRTADLKIIVPPDEQD